MDWLIFGLLIGVLICIAMVRVAAWYLTKKTDKRD